MIIGSVCIAHSKSQLLSSVQKTETAWERTKGLLGRRGLEDGEGLLITPCSSIHTFFMTFPLDVVYLDREDKIVKLIENLRPWRMSGCFRSAKVLEVGSRFITNSGIKVGDQLLWERNE